MKLLPSALVGQADERIRLSLNVNISLTYEHCKMIQDFSTQFSPLYLLKTGGAISWSHPVYFKN